VLAGHRAGVRTVVLPRRNKPDVLDVPADVREDLLFIYADRGEDVLAAALGWTMPGRGSTGGATGRAAVIGEGGRRSSKTRASGPGSSRGEVSKKGGAGRRKSVARGARGR
jgi:hypothetical protein